ncbi:MAG: macro domain-containing protein [Anaerolineales bacterium]|nr:macro domain-containing protein [Anaerolineales bacterium]
MSTTLRHTTLPPGRRLLVVQGDLVREQVDAIVNAANAHLQHGGGVAAAIASRGGPSIQQESLAWVREHGPVSHDSPAYTSAGDLPCRYIIHAVGPVWGEGDEPAKLQAAVHGSLALADRLELASLAIPAISTGIFGYPKRQAARVILNTIEDYFLNQPESGLTEVRLTLYDAPTVEAFTEVWDTRLAEEAAPPGPASLRELPKGNSQITSSRNPKVQWIKALQGSARKRRQEGVFVIEGIRLLEEASQAGIVPRLILHTAELSDRGRQLLARFSPDASEILEASPGALKAASDTISPQGILAVCPLPEPALPHPELLVLVLDRLRDPGNLGTILRTAAVLGVGQALLAPESTDPFSPKVLRAGMGAQFQLAIASLAWPEIAAHLRLPVEGQTVQILLAETAAGAPLTAIDFRQPTALIIGGEAEGASPEARRLAHQSVSIPMPGGGESLNAAVAAGILLYEAARQRS